MWPGQKQKARRQNKFLGRTVNSLLHVDEGKDFLSSITAMQYDEKMFLYLNLGRLQAELLHQSLDNEDEILLAIAGIKQVNCFGVYSHQVNIYLEKIPMTWMLYIVKRGEI